MRPFTIRANRALSQDSGSESALSLYSVSGANPDIGIWKTVRVTVGASGDDGDLASERMV